MSSPALGARIRKASWPCGVTPNIVDAEAAAAAFSWSAAAERLDGLPGGGLNIAHEAVDRHAGGPLGVGVAMRWLHRDGTQSAMTYAELSQATNRFANVLRGLGVAKGDRVFTLTGRIPELYVAALGTLKNGSVLSPLFPAFGPEPIRERITRGDGKVLVTTPTLFRRRIAGMLDRLPSVEHMLVTGAGPPSGTRSLDLSLASASDRFVIAPTHPQDMALLHFTSGTTGSPKGAIHVHGAVVAHHATAWLGAGLPSGATCSGAPPTRAG